MEFLANNQNFNQKVYLFKMNNFTITEKFILKN